MVCFCVAYLIISEKLAKINIFFIIYNIIKSNMKIIHKHEALDVNKPEGLEVDYYLRSEYEVHFNVQSPKSDQIWHHHEQIFETIFIIEGELTAKWKKNGKVFKEIVRAGSLIETENTPHNFINHTDKTAKFLVIKQVLSGKNKKELFKVDKILD